MAIQSNFPTLRPSLDLNFASSRTVDPRITFSRAGTGNIASYFDEKGVMRFAPPNTPRIDFDPVTLACKGLLIEEQRTNLLLNSETLATQSVTVTATAHTLSFYGTGTVTLSGAFTGTLVGAGASTRVALVFTPTAGSLTLTVTGSCTLAQLEVGAFPTSYISTTSAQVTRGADFASMQGANFSSWYRQDECTLFAEASGAKTKFIACIDDGTVSNRLQVAIGSNSAFEFYSVVAGSATISFSGGTSPTSEFTKAKFSSGIKSGSTLASVNGTLPFGSTPSTGAVPNSLSNLRIGSNWAGGNSLCGHISCIAVYTKRVTDQQLQAMTA